MVPDKTVIVTDSPIYAPDDKTVTSYEIHGTLSALRQLTIVSSREVALPALLAHLQSMWDNEVKSCGRHDHAGMEMA